MKLSDCRFLLPFLVLLLCNSLNDACYNADIIDGNSFEIRESNLRNSRSMLTSNIIESETPCPDAVAIFPCFCSLDASNRTILDCTNIMTEEELETVFQQEFPVKQLFEFFMSHNSAITVLGDILNGVTFESIRLYQGPFALEEISESFLLSIKDTLTDIRIKDSELTSDGFPFAILPQLENLEFIYIYGSLITWIPQITAPNIGTLYITRSLTDNIEADTFPIYEWSSDVLVHENQIQTIAPGSFFFADENSATSSSELVINLSNNDLTSIQAGTIPLRNGPMSIALNCNNILTIEPGAFILPEATDNLSIKLYLYENVLETLDEAALGDVMPFVINLQLFANNLACGCDMAWIILNPAYLEAIDLNSKCADETYIHLLDPLDFLNC